jgi:metallophosphoesterase superfamily enzyme
MRPTAPRPIPGAPALVLPALRDHPTEIAVADLHLGLPSVGAQGIGLAEETARSMADRLTALARGASARGIVVAGDLKHPIVGAPPPVARMVFDFFSTLLGEGLEVRVVLGNHDVGIVRHLPREVRVHSAEGWRRGDLGIFHGHAWPSRRVLRASRLLVGHLHPGFRLAGGGASAGKQQCWVRADLPPPRGPRSSAHRIEASEVIVLPAFNPIAGIESLNREAPTRGRSFLFHRFLGRGRPRAYLLDGTDLGPLPNWGGGAQGRSAPAR